MCIFELFFHWFRRPNYLLIFGQNLAISYFAHFGCIRITWTLPALWSCRLESSSLASSSTSSSSSRSSSCSWSSRTGVQLFGRLPTLSLWNCCCWILSIRASLSNSKVQGAGFKQVLNHRYVTFITNAALSIISKKMNLCFVFQFDLVLAFFVKNIWLKVYWVNIYNTGTCICYDHNTWTI